MWWTAYTTCFNLFTAFSSWCENIKQLVSFIAIKSTNKSMSELVSQSVSDKHSQTVTTSFELPSSHARVTSIKFSKRESVSELVSQWVTDKHCQWSDSGPIKKRDLVFQPTYSRPNRSSKSLFPIAPSLRSASPAFPCPCYCLDTPPENTILNSRHHKNNIDSESLNKR